MMNIHEKPFLLGMKQRNKQKYVMDFVEKCRRNPMTAWKDRKIPKWNGKIEKL